MQDAQQRRLVTGGVGIVVAGGSGDGKQDVAPGIRCGNRRVSGNVVSITGNALVFLAPAVAFLREEGALQHGFGCRINLAPAAVEHPAQGVHARGGQVIEEVTAPCSRTLLVGGGSARLEAASGIGIAKVGVEITEIVDGVGLVADVQGAVAIEVGSVIVGFVVDLVVLAHHQHVQRRLPALREQRLLGNINASA